MDHTPLDPSSLSAAGQKALAPGPLKMMAARGLAPLPRAVELVSVLYQLSLDSDKTVAAAAEKSAGELPDRVLSGALSDTSIDPRVVDFFSTRVDNRPALLQQIILNPATADETAVALAATGTEATVDLIAQNEQRLLRCPDLIAAMYTNARARMSTVDRAVELAARGGLKVPAIAAWEEVARAALSVQSGRPSAQALREADETFAKIAEVATSDKTRPDDDGDTQISNMTIPMKIRLATMGNKFARTVLVRDAVKLVSMAAIKAPGVRDSEALAYASSNSLHEDVISYIAKKREWTKLYSVKLALVQNPKTPVRLATQFLVFLRDKDLQAVSRSKGVPSVIAVQAKKRLLAKQRGGAR